MDTRFAISEYLDAAQVTAQLDALIKKPIYSISPAALKKYEEEYFDKKCAKSKAMITEAKEIIPGGVQHNLAFNYPFPIVMTKAKGAKLYDIDGNEYYDFLQAGGPTILGSNDDVVKEKVKELLDDCGPSTGLFHEYEYKLAKKISDCVPSVEMFRMLGSGTEACMCAVRVARLATGHKNIIKMGGAYHGWSDQLAWGMRVPGTMNLQSHGVPLFVFKHTQEFFPNDLKSLERKLILNKFRGGTAAVFIEAIGPESGTRPVDKDFPKGVQALCRKYGALLVCDEVVTGFRIGVSGAQGYFGIDPDITIFGKVIAGGYPGAGGIGGHREVMKYLGAGLDRLVHGLQALIKKYDLPFVCFNQGSVCHLDTVGTMHFKVDWKHPWTIPHTLKETGKRQSEMEHMGAAYMAEGLVTLAGSRLYTSAAYTEEMIDDCLNRFENVFKNCVCIEA